MQFAYPSDTPGRGVTVRQLRSFPTRSDSCGAELQSLRLMIIRPVPTVIQYLDFCLLFHLLLSCHLVLAYLGLLVQRRQ